VRAGRGGAGAGAPAGRRPRGDSRADTPVPAGHQDGSAHGERHLRGDYSYNGPRESFHGSSRVLTRILASVPGRPGGRRARGCSSGAGPGAGETGGARGQESKIDRPAVNSRGDRPAGLIDPEFTTYPLRGMADAALQHAAELGAQYADFRAERIRSQRIGLSDGSLETLYDADDVGLAVRVVVEGTWGFASTV